MDRICWLQPCNPPSHPVGSWYDCSFKELQPTQRPEGTTKVAVSHKISTMPNKMAMEVGQRWIKARSKPVLGWVRADLCISSILNIQSAPPGSNIPLWIYLLYISKKS